MSYKIQQRHVLVFMIFFAIVAGLMQRNVLYMSITRMVNLPNANVDEIPSDQAICTAPSWNVQLNKTIDLCDNIKEITVNYLKKNHRESKLISNLTRLATTSQR